ncbi:protein PLANT CADMIUM RESISTANCE 10 [Sesamum alatum]|uniref:Protein PLANT CADMIUM RESISTANCE 10 n=1 Tax=Sesamum alatum TaxID=300844 RepID=A0AAE1YL59_9LAMI|nr:protein PLANT CADMIUM RESISTANCE 10 [Sesamum alatum]
MVAKTSYAAPSYVPLDTEVDPIPPEDATPLQQNINDHTGQWSSGICACFDDIQSCGMGLFCPSHLFGMNAEFLGSGTLRGSCMTHFILFTLINALCCLLTEGISFGLPGCLIAPYACGYRRTLRSKYNLQEAPCGDFFTHLFCHLCAICQEYREIHRRCRDSDSNSPGPNSAQVTPPLMQTIDSDSSTD